MCVGVKLKATGSRYKFKKKIAQDEFMVAIQTCISRIYGVHQ